MDARTVLWAGALGVAERFGAHDAFVRRFGPVASSPTPLPADLAPTAPDHLGDLLESLGDDVRSASFEALLAGRFRHGASSAVETTQRFTPPWIARWLVDAALEVAGASCVPAIDPACGGGRLLLALYRGLRARGHAPTAILAEHLVGADVDPLAAEVARWSLWLEAASACEDAESLPTPHVYALAPPMGSLAPFEAVAAGTASNIEAARFAVVVSNPPYMANRHLGEGVREALVRDFGVFKGDLYTAFLRRCVDLAAVGGALGVLCQESFLFLHRDRALRRVLFEELQLDRVLHLGAHAFDAIGGEKASVVAFAGRRQRAVEAGPIDVIDLHDLRTPAAKERTFEAVERGELGVEWRRTRSRSSAQRARRGDPWVYWWPDALAHLPALPGRLADALDIAGSANKTSDNARFVRRFWEVPARSIGPDAHPDHRWVPYAKGGPYRKWAGNLERVVDWSPEARTYYRSHTTSNLLPERYWFREGLTWSDFGGRAFSLRHLPAGCVFDMAGPSMFLRDSQQAALPLPFWLAFLNSPLVCHLLNADNPTIHYQVHNLRNLPIPDLPPHDPHVLRLTATGRAALTLAARLESFELTSPDFYAHPLLSVDPAIDDLPTALAAAADLPRALHAELRALEAEAAAHVEALYGAPHHAVAPLDRRLTLPRLRLPTVAHHLIDALGATVALAEGRLSHPAIPTPAPGESTLHEVDAIGLQLWGAARWSALLEARHQTLGRFVEVSYGPWLRERFFRRPWHPSRIVRKVSG